VKFAQTIHILILWDDSLFWLLFDKESGGIPQYRQLFNIQSQLSLYCECAMTSE